eukprot:GGOE01020328.1.p1 GENE.GGOE01020328.1~~GGOE01020328.1.p1  ORF type:complete len:1194 (-),score=396.51 GGOE01020328.1:239-3778(-)
MSHLTKSPKRVIGLYGCPGIQAPLAALFASHAGELENQVTFQLLDSDQALTCFRKEPHQYAVYRPDGILKTSWFAKHQERVCSCILVLFDWSVYIDRLGLETALAMKLDKVRNLTKARSPRLLLVLLSLPSVLQVVADRGGKLELVGDGVGLDICPMPFAEQVGLMRKRLDLDSRYIIILQGCSQLDLVEVATRTMRIAGDCSTAYILDAARHLKQHKGEVNKAAQPYLCARHRFKEGWYHEMLRDASQALKHYRQAYEHVQAITTAMYPPEEVRAVGEFIHDRIVTILLWWERDIRGALESFSSHIRWFATVVFDASRFAAAAGQAPWVKVLQATDSLLLNASLASQYERMADSLSSLNGAVAWTTMMSPGHFYHLAAEMLRKHMKHHKRLEQMFQQVSGTYAAANLRPQFYDSGFIGKSPPVALKDDTGADVELERKDMIFTFLRIYNEQEGAGYEDLLLNFLNKCLESYHLLYAPRLMARICFEIAEALAARREWAKARRQIADKMLDTMKEQWFGLGGRMLLLSMLCSAKLDEREAWLRLALQAISSPVAKLELRLQWLAAVLAYVMGKEVPQSPALPLPPLTWDAGEEVILPDDHPFLTVKAQFSEAVAREHAPVLFRLFLATQCPDVVPVLRVNISFNDPTQNLSKTWEGSAIDLRPGEPLILEFPMTAEDPTLLRCTEVALELVPLEDASAGLRLRWCCTVDAVMERRLEDDGAKYNYRHDVGFQDFLHRPLIRFVELQPKLTLEVVHAAPALLGEDFSFSLRVNANEDAVQGGHVTLPHIPGLLFWRDGEPAPPAEAPNGAPTFPFGPIAAGAVLELPLHLRASRAGTFGLSLEVTYASELSPSLSVGHSLQLEAVHPFDVQVSFTDTLMWKKPKDAKGPAVSTPYRLPGRTAAFVERTNTYGGSSGPSSPLQPLSPLTDAGSNTHLPSSIRISPLGTEPGSDAYGSPTSHTFRKDQPVEVLVRLIATTPFPIVIRRVQLVPNVHDQVSILQESSIPEDEGEELSPAEELEQAFCLLCSAASSLVTCGHLTVSAHRAGSPAPLHFTFPLPQISVAAAPLVVGVECNTVAAMGEVLRFKLLVLNTTHHMQAVTVRVSDSRSFFWAGRASFMADIRPGQEAEFPYNLIPIQTGTVFLPPIDLQDQLAGVPLLLPAEKLSVFVYPKNHPSTPMA